MLYSSQDVRFRPPYLPQAWQDLRGQRAAGRLPTLWPSSPGKAAFITLPVDLSRRPTARREGRFGVSTFKEPFRVEGKADEDERIVLLITGNGLKQLL